MRRHPPASELEVGAERPGCLFLGWLLTVGFVIFFGPLHTSAAEEAPEQSETLEFMKEEETVSIASRYEQPISQAPSNVYVITDEDIRHSGATDIPTILRRIPGLEVMQTTGAMFNVSIRGDNQINANKLLVMVDGRSIYIDVQGGVNWRVLPVTLPEIKRIEVLKGPASAVYGFNAFDGVINIITKSPEEMRGTTLQVGGGEYGTLTTSAIQGGKIGDIGYRVSIGHNQNAQWRDRNALAFRDNLFNLQTDYALPSSAAKIKVAGGLVESNRFDGQFSQETVTASRPTQGYASVAYERPTFFLRAFWNYYSDTPDSRFTGVLAPFLTTITYRGREFVTTFAANTYNVDAQHSLKLWPGNLLTYGANFRYNTLSSPFLTHFTTERRLGIFLQDEHELSQSLTLVAGARYDLDTFINPTMSPRVALLYRPASDHSFRISWAIAYRPPTMVETNALSQSNAVFLPVPIVSQAIPNLDPEQIISYEASYQGWYFRHRLQVRAAVFFNHITDLINSKDVLPTLTTRVNDPGSTDIYGGEAGLDFLVTRWLSGFANYSYQETGQSFTGQLRRGTPRFKWNAGLRGEWENGLSSEIAYHYYGAAIYPLGDAFTSLQQAGLIAALDPRVGSYNLLNVRAGYKFWKQKAAAGYMREAEAALSAFNSLNDKHKEHPLGDTIGSRIMGWLTVRC